MAEDAVTMPMRLAAWMDHVREAETPFLSVQGAADLAAAMAQPDALQRNTCYMAYASEAVMGDHEATPLRRIEVAVVSALLNRRDRRGEEAISDLEIARWALSAALLGWEPPGAAGRISFRRGDVTAYTRHTLWWRDVYSVPAFASSLPLDAVICPELVQARAEAAVVSLEDVGPPDEETNRRVWVMDPVRGNG